MLGNMDGGLAWQGRRGQDKVPGVRTRVLGVELLHRMLEQNKKSKGKMGMCPV